jgi:general secretion pathway protein D
MKIRAAVAALTALGLATPALAETNGPVKETKDPAADEPLFKCQKKSGDFNVSFKPEIEVKELITWINTIVCKTVTLDQRVVATTRKVTIMAPSKMTSVEAYRLFLVALATIGYDVVPGNYMKVVESQSIKRENLPLYIGGKVEVNDHVVRYAYRPTYAQVETLVTAFNALKSDAGDVQLIGGMLLITERGTHLEKMLTLGRLIDVPKGSDGIYLLPVKHADATKLVDKLNTILGLGKEAPATTPGKPGDPVKAPPVAIAVPSKIVVEERTNTLIVTGSANAYERVKALVEGIDIRLEIEGGASIHVYRLGSSIAEELAKTLESLISGQQRTATAKPGAPTPAAPVTQPHTPTNPAAPGAAGISSALEGQVRIIADKPTNSLIVMSSGRDYFALKEVIRQLDMPKRQVYIETVILEVQAGSSLDLGTSSHGGIPGTGMMVGGVQLPPLSSLGLAGGASALPAGFVGALIGKELPGSRTMFGKSIPSYGVLFQALAGNDSAKLVSARASSASITRRPRTRAASTSRTSAAPRRSRTAASRRRRTSSASRSSSSSGSSPTCSSTIR